MTYLIHTCSGVAIAAAILDAASLMAGRQAPGFRADYVIVVRPLPDPHDLQWRQRGDVCSRGDQPRVAASVRRFATRPSNRVPLRVSVSSLLRV